MPGGMTQAGSPGRSHVQFLTGKAFYVYWPHGVPFGPDVRLNRDTRLIFRPYVERMKWIR